MGRNADPAKICLEKSAQHGTSGFFEVGQAVAEHLDLCIGGRIAGHAFGEFVDLRSHMGFFQFQHDALKLTGIVEIGRAHV